MKAATRRNHNGRISFLKYYKHLIRVVRIGSKAEVHPESNDEEPRLVFELEYLESLPAYEKISLTQYYYKDTLLGRILK